MYFQAALSLAVFGALALADAQEPRQNSCVMCTEVVPTCPVCPDSQQCFVSVPQGCTECPEAYCADAAADATPTPTGILGGTTSSTSEGGFTLPTASESETSAATATATSTSSSSTTTTTAPEGSSTGASDSATGTAEAPGAESSAPAASGVGRNADLAGVLGVALWVVAPVLGLQWLC